MRHYATLTAALSSILLTACISALALDPSLDVNQYAHTAWKVREGFVGSEINSIAQTPDGYIWLATQFGLFRFDGVRNLPWQPPQNQHLPPGTIYSLLVDRDGTLWIGGKGLASFKDGKLTHYPELAGHYIFQILEDHERTIWASGLTEPFGKLCAIQNGNIRCYGQDGTLGIGASSLYEDSKGNLWAGVLNGLWRWKPGPPKYYSLAGQRDGIQALAEDNDGTLLVGWAGGIYRFIDGKTRPYSLRGVSQPVRARRMLRDRDGGLWIGTGNRGLLHVHRGRTDVFAQADGISSDSIHSLFEDRESNIWVATTNGLDRFRNLAVVTLNEKQGLSSDIVGAVLPDRDGSLWFGTRGGLDRSNNGQIKTYPIHPESLFQDDRGRIWASTPRGLGYLENGRFTSVKGVPGGNMLSISQDTAGNLWVINETAGLFGISPHNDNVRQIRWSGFGHKDHASVLAADARYGGLWIGFFLGGMAYFSDGQVREIYATTDGLGAGRVSDFYFDTEGTLWISTEGGLSRLKNNRVATMTSKNGLPCDTVHWAIEDNDHSMWLYTACGLVRIARPELDAWAAAVDKSQDASRPIRVMVFDSLDGVRSVSGPGHYHPQVAKTPDGKLWFLPWDGVSFINLRHIPFNKLPPPVHIEQVTADGKNYDPANGLQLPPHVRDLAIDYTALSLVAPEKIHFRYKLEGQDPDWREVVNDRQVQYSNLAPRHYTFRVMACNNSGVWNEAGASLEFSVLPAFYQTNGFRVFCVFGFLALLWGTYQLRIRQLQQQFNIALDARVNERTRIARELHDTLLQNFHGVMFQFQAARNVMHRRPDEAIQFLDDAIGETKKALAESREAIQDLRSEPIAKGNLAELLMFTSRELAVSNANEHSPVFDLIEEGERRALSSRVSNDVCRIALELLRNVYQHAHAQTIEAEIRYGDSNFRLRIRDDGRGIDPKVLKDGGKLGHWGLRGVRERADRIGAHLDVWSEPGNGTEVQLLVPASIAYENFPDSYRAKLLRKVKRHAERS